MRRRLLAALLLALVASPARGDVFRPAYLELREAGDGRYDVLWRVPAQGEGMRLALAVRFPADTEVVAPPRGHLAGGSWVERWQVRRPGGLVGQPVRIEGLAGGVTDAIARVERADGTSQVERLLPARPAFTVEASAGAAAVAWSYLSLGFTHILGGSDHLLFVLALLLLVSGGRRLCATITAFTVAHSLTLAAAALGFVRVPSAPVDAIVALSIVFAAAEVVHGLRGQPGLTARAPWVMAFAFGLLHGLGFAGALTEMGLPQRAVPLALLAFNGGVELGQLAFVAAVLAARAGLLGLAPRWPRWAPLVPAYAIGAVAAWWTLARIAAFRG